MSGSLRGREGGVSREAAQPPPPSLEHGASRSSPFRPTPLVAQSLALRWAGFEVCTTRCCMSRQVRFLLQRWEAQAGLSLFGEKLQTKGCPAGGAGGDRGAPRPPPTYLASRVRAMMPAAKGAEAEVPV